MTSDTIPGHRIVYVGDLRSGGTCLQRMRALAALGSNVIPINTMDDRANALNRTLLTRVFRKLGRPLDHAGVNSRIREVLASTPADIVWLDKALTVRPETLEEVRRLRPDCRIVGYSPDDMCARLNQSTYFRHHLRHYDVYFTTKSFGVAELLALGCPRVVFVGNAYDPATHRPMSLTDEERRRWGGPVGFIGTWEPERARSLARLALRGHSVRIWGEYWRRATGLGPTAIVEGKAIYGDDYARALSAFDINLCFLRRLSRDLQTTRSVEIPACGGFMLAERTEQHQALFEENKEAVYFGSDEELCDKVGYYLAHPDERLAIAARGRERCLRGGYSNHERLKWMLGQVHSKM